jgi:hypothetical protein
MRYGTFKLVSHDSESKKVIKKESLTVASSKVVPTFSALFGLPECFPKFKRDNGNTLLKASHLYPS